MGREFRAIPWAVDIYLLDDKLNLLKVVVAF
jgi:hypothetical protein